MADDDTDADDAAAGGGGGKKKLIIFIVLGILLIGLSIGGTLFAVKMMTPEPTVAEGAEGEEGSAEEEPEEEIKMPAIYFPLKPPIIVNFNARGRQRFLQAELTLMTRENDVIEAVELHMPMIRNSLVLLFGGQVYEELQTAEGKELLRQQALTDLQSILEQEIGKTGIEQVLFTNFVMQ